jgi:glycosyltransferase involved in cell wall biosynthesis
MRILFLNPFHGGSHAAVAEGYARHSRHEVKLLTLSIDGGWRWRMRGAAVSFARMLRGLDGRFDLILATDMLDLATFLGLTRDLTAGIPVALYVHENQLTYPLPPGRPRDLAFSWINYTSALAADRIFFNSGFHRRAFLEALPGLVGRYHDHQERDLAEALTTKAQVLPPGIDLARLDPITDRRPPTADHRPPTADRRTGEEERGRGGEGENVLNSQFSIFNSQSPVILWNSRWEYDKRPEVFFEALRALEARGVDFRVIVAGEHIDPNEPNFAAARAWLAPRTLAWGYAPDLATYRDLLWQADIVVSTAIQEFFGISIVEAMYCGCVPVLPRRLSYPELLPPQYHAGCLYDEPADLVDRLVAVIADLPALRARDFRGLAAQYDWTSMAPRYDAAFERVGE